jgi:uncharacterized protein (TIGR02996 family)
MDREEAFLRAIREDARDVTARLVYADWLEEHGHAGRAELVRVAEAMRQLPVFSDEYWRLKSRRNELRGQCPADWLAATGYDGSRYDAVYRHGIPTDWKGRWRLIREFAEVWHGLATGDVGGHAEVVRAEESRLGLQLPPSVREYVAYAHDVVPEGEVRCVHRDPYTMRRMDDHQALSLMRICEGDLQWAVAYDELDREDPPVYTYIGPDEDPARYVRYEEPGRDVPTVSGFVLGFVVAYKPNAGDFAAEVAGHGELKARLDSAFPIRIEERSIQTYEGEGILVELFPPVNGRSATLEVCVHPKVTWEQVPAFLWEFVPGSHSRGGMFFTEADRQRMRGQFGEDLPAGFDFVPPPLRGR